MLKSWVTLSWTAMGILVMGVSVIRPAPAAPPTLGGCSVLPADNIWNVPVDTLPVDPNSNTYVAAMGANSKAHADFGKGVWPDPGGYPIGIPYTTVVGTTPKMDVTFDYADESDIGPYPIPPNVPIEGDPNGSGDRHALILDKDHCVLYELYALHQVSGQWYAGSGAIFTTTVNGPLRPDTWTSADAAGLPMLPGLVRYDEVAAGEINHAIRFTSNTTKAAHVWPARHQAAYNTQAGSPPMGQRFRLKASFEVDSRFSPEVQVILRALKKYGMILADNGTSWYLSGAPDEQWNNSDLHALDTYVKGSDFEAVDVSSLMINSNSGQVLSDFTLSPSPSARAIDPGGSTSFQLSAGVRGYWTSPVTVTASEPSPSVTIGLSGSIVNVPGSINLTVTDTHPIGSPAIGYSIPITATGHGVTHTVQLSVLIGGTRVYLPIVLKG